MYYLIVLFGLTLFGLVWVYRQLINLLAKLNARTRHQEKTIHLLESELDLCITNLAKLNSLYLKLNDKLNYLADDKNLFEIYQFNLETTLEQINKKIEIIDKRTNGYVNIGYHDNCGIAEPIFVNTNGAAGELKSFLCSHSYTGNATFIKSKFDFLQIDELDKLIEEVNNNFEVYKSQSANSHFTLYWV